MSYIQETLEPGEQIVYTGRLHWTFQFRYTFAGIVCLAIALGCLVYLAYMDAFADSTATTVTSFVLAILGLGCILFGYFLRSKTEFAITTNRFIQKDGILNVKMTEIPLFKVETINFYQSLFDRIVGTGQIQLVGSGGTDHTVSFLQNPHEVRKLIMANIKKSKEEE